MLTLKEIIEDEMRWAEKCSPTIPKDAVLASLRRIARADEIERADNNRPQQGKARTRA